MADTKIVRLTTPNGVTVGVSEEKSKVLLANGYTKHNARAAKVDDAENSK